MNVRPRTGEGQGGAMFPAGAAENEMMLRQEGDEPLGVRGLRQLQDNQEAAGAQRDVKPGQDTGAHRALAGTIHQAGAGGGGGDEMPMKSLWSKRRERWDPRGIRSPGRGSDTVGSPTSVHSASPSASPPANTCQDLRACTAS